MYCTQYTNVKMHCIHFTVCTNNIKLKCDTDTYTCDLCMCMQANGLITSFTITIRQSKQRQTGTQPTT